MGRLVLVFVIGVVIVVTGSAVASLGAERGRDNQATELASCCSTATNPEAKVDDQRVLGLEAIEDLSDSERSLVDRSLYPPDTHLTVYVVGNERRIERYIAPFDETIEIGSRVESFGSWAVAGQLATSSGEPDIEIHMAQAIRVTPLRPGD